MKTLSLTPGSAEWHTYRNRPSARNASEASAVMGCSPYLTRSELIRRKATGITPEVDEHTQARFDDGHQAEALARPNAEEIAGVELYAVTGVLDSDERLSASFDGLSMCERIVWENKLFNADKADEVAAERIPGADFWQCVQQAIVSGCELLLYTLADRDGTIRAHVTITGDTLRLRAAELLAGWDQFDADVAAYVPEPVKAAVVATPVAGFGALSIRVEGRVLVSNLDAFTDGARAFLARLPDAEMLQTDQDFANAEAAVKACSEAEDRIKAERAAVLAQMSDIDAVLRAADTISETIRAARLALDRAVKAEKENRRQDIINRAVEAIRLHLVRVNEPLPVDYGVLAPATLTADLGAAIKGLKSLASMADKVSGVVAKTKIAITTDGERHRANLALLAQADRPALFVDAGALVRAKQPDDLRNLIAARIAEADAREQARLDAERAKIRAEEEARALREAERLAEQERQRIRNEEQARAQAEQAGLAHSVPDTTPTAPQAASNDPEAIAPPNVTAPSMIEGLSVVLDQSGCETGEAVPTGKLIKLGEINARIAPLSITGDGLAALGFQHHGMERAAKLYREADFKHICRALCRVLTDAMALPPVREAA